MILAYEDLIASCISAGIQGDGRRAEEIYTVDFPAAVDAEHKKGTADAITEGIEAKKRMEEILDTYFPIPG